MTGAGNHAVSASATAATIGAFFGSISGILSPIVAIAVGLLAATWYLVQLYESETVQAWLKGREFVRLRARQIAAAKVLKAAQEADAKALAAFQEAEARALRIRQAAGVSQPTEPS